MPGLTKRTINKLAGAMTDFSVLVIGFVVLFLQIYFAIVEILVKIYIGVDFDVYWLLDDRRIGACDALYYLLKCQRF